MKDIMQKLAELEATAPKAKKMLTEDTISPIIEETKDRTLKNVFQELSETATQPFAILDPQNKQSGVGVLKSNNPAVDKVLQALNPKEVQVVQTTTQGQQPTQTTPAPAGATGQPVQGQQPMREKDEGKPGKNFAKIAKSAGERYGSKAAGERVAGAIRAKLAKQGKLEEEVMEEDMEENYSLTAPTLDNPGKHVTTSVSKPAASSGPWPFTSFEIGQFPETLRNVAHAQKFINNGKLTPDTPVIVKSDDGKRTRMPAKDAPHLAQLFGIKEGAKVDRMVKHIEKSERKLGKSKEKASDIAWATANKRGMLDNKNKKKVKEADIPSSQGIDNDSPFSGSARSNTTLEGKTMSKAKPDFLDMDKDGNKKESMKKAVADKKKKTVKEGIDRFSLAEREGQLHGLKNAAHCGKNYEDLDERRAYHRGYIRGLDESFGDEGMYEAAPAMPAATVGGMANQELDEISSKVAYDTLAKRQDQISRGQYSGFKGDPIAGIKSSSRLMTRAGIIDNPNYRGPNDSYANEAEFDEGNAFTGKLAGTKHGGKFSLGGKTFTDRSNYDAKLGEGDFAFESWSNQLNELLNEGLSVSVSKGQQNSPDSVTITAQDAEADQLLQLVKHAGLGLFGDDHAEPSQAMSIQPTTGEPDEVGAGGADIEVVDGSDDMLSLIQKLGGISSSDDEDYADEEGHGDELHGDEGHDEDTNEANCNECGMMETECQCDKEQVEEVESEDQQLYNVAEDNPPDSDEAETSADEEAEAEEDKALATKSMNESFTDILARLNALSESKKEDDNEDENPEEDGPDHGKAWHDTSDELKENEEDEEDAIEESEDLTEWANQVGPGEGKGTDASFEEDIEFMTKVIAGGLNKPKSTGQTTVPVIAGQNERMHDHQGSISDTVDDWAKLAGIK